MHHDRQDKQVERGLAALPFRAVQSQNPFRARQQNRDGVGPNLLGQGLRVSRSQGRGSGVSAGGWPPDSVDPASVLLTRHQLRELMQADLTSSHQRNKGAGKEGGKKRAAKGRPRESSCSCTDSIE